MFYSTQILARKGPLGVVWMAAHMERKLNRHQVHEASISGTVDVLLSPEAPLALRLSGQLLLGVCRIYARKVTYLLQDCQDALVKIRLAFKVEDLQAALKKVQGRAGVGGAAPGPHTLPLDSITLPDGLDELQLLAGDAFDLLALQPAMVLDAVVAEMSQSQDRRRRGSMAQAGSASMQAYSPGLLLTSSASQRLDAYSQDGLHFLPADELFDDDHEVAGAVFPFDLEEVEVERLRAAPAADAMAGERGLAALMSGAGGGSTPFGQTPGDAGGGANDSPSTGLRSAAEQSGGPSAGRHPSVALKPQRAGSSTARAQHGAEAGPFDQLAPADGFAAHIGQGLAELPDLAELGAADMDLDFNFGDSPSGAKAASADRRASARSGGAAPQSETQPGPGEVCALAMDGDDQQHGSDAENDGALGEPVAAAQPARSGGAVSPDDVAAAAAAAVAMAAAAEPYDLPPDLDDGMEVDTGPTPRTAAAAVEGRGADGAGPSTIPEYEAPAAPGGRRSSLSAADAGAEQAGGSAEVGDKDVAMEDVGGPGSAAAESAAVEQQHAKPPGDVGQPAAAGSARSPADASQQAEEAAPSDRRIMRPRRGAQGAAASPACVPAPGGQAPPAGRATAAGAAAAAGAPEAPRVQRVAQRKAKPSPSANRAPVTFDSDGTTLATTQLRDWLQDRSELLTRRGPQRSVRQKTQDSGLTSALLPAAPNLGVLFSVAAGRLAPGYALAMGAAAGNARGPAAGHMPLAPMGTPAAAGAYLPAAGASPSPQASGGGGGGGLGWSGMASPASGVLNRAMPLDGSLQRGAADMAGPSGGSLLAAPQPRQSVSPPAPGPAAADRLLSGRGTHEEQPLTHHAAPCGNEQQRHTLQGQPQPSSASMPPQEAEDVDGAAASAGMMDNADAAASGWEVQGGQTCGGGAGPAWRHDDAGPSRQSAEEGGADGGGAVHGVDGRALGQGAHFHGELPSVDDTRQASAAADDDAVGAGTVQLHGGSTHSSRSTRDGSSSDKENIANSAEAAGKHGPSTSQALHLHSPRPRQRSNVAGDAITALQPITTTTRTTLTAGPGDEEQGIGCTAALDERQCPSRSIDGDDGAADADAGPGALARSPADSLGASRPRASAGAAAFALGSIPEDDLPQHSPVLPALRHLGQGTAGPSSSARPSISGATPSPALHRPGWGPEELGGGGALPAAEPVWAGLGLASALRQRSSYGAAGTPAEARQGGASSSGLQMRTFTVLQEVASSQHALATQQACDAAAAAARPAGSAQPDDDIALMLQRQDGAAAGGASQPCSQQTCTTSLTALTQGRTRMDAARCFYDLLVLKSRGLLELQPQCCDGPLVQAGPSQGADDAQAGAGAGTSDSLLQGATTMTGFPQGGATQRCTQLSQLPVDLLITLTQEGAMHL